jgi:DNA-binding GntR family transcriptional regulator
MNAVLDQLAVAPARRYREAAYTAIKEAILDARLEGGEPLFEERLAEALGISRTPVREALAILEHERLIAPRRGKGLFIRELTREEFLDMFGANEVVEPYLGRRAALLATDAELQELQAAIDRGIQAAIDNDIYASLRSGRDFHFWLGTAAGNESLRQMVARNEEQTDLFLLSLGNRDLVDVASMEASNREHQEILDAIRLRDPEAAARNIIFHSHSLRTRWAPLFRSGSDQSPSNRAISNSRAVRR